MRSGHCGATSSDHWSWHPLATSEGDKVISYTVWKEQESRSNCTSVYFTLLMSFWWFHSVDVHCECHFVDVTLSNLIGWFHLIDITLKFLPCLCHFFYLCHSVDVNLLMSLYLQKALWMSNNLKGWLIHLKVWQKQLRPSSLNYQLEASKPVVPFLLVVPTTGYNGTWIYMKLHEITCTYLKLAALTQI